MTGPLLAASRGLELVNAAARLLYESGWRRRVRVGAPVVSVGNIALGGTGKSPLVAALARTLLEAGARPAVITRGYGRRAAEPALAWRDPEASWELVGDEPAQLARALPQVPVVADADRARGARRALAETGATHLLLDDGFQHWRLERDLDIVVLAADDPLCRHAPRREHPRALERASAVVVNGEQEVAQAVALALRARLAPRPLLAVRPAAVALHDTLGRRPPAELAGARVVALAGIARPERFAATLRALGADVVRTVDRPDHHVWQPGELGRVLAEAERDGLLPVTTGKDAVKLPVPLMARVAWLEIGLEPLDGSFHQLLAPVMASATIAP